MIELARRVVHDLLDAWLLIGGAFFACMVIGLLEDKIQKLRRRAVHGDPVTHLVRAPMGARSASPTRDRALPRPELRLVHGSLSGTDRTREVRPAVSP